MFVAGALIHTRVQLYNDDTLCQQIRAIIIRKIYLRVHIKLFKVAYGVTHIYMHYHVLS